MVAPLPIFLADGNPKTVSLSTPTKDDDDDDDEVT